MEKYYRDALFDLRTTVTKDVAIAILLGLRSVDPVRPDHNPQGNPHAKHRKYLAELDISIFEVIRDMRDSAQMDVDDAIEEKDQIKKDASKAEVIRCDDLMREAHRYLCDLNFELAKDEKSILKVDRSATKTPTNPYIEVASLDEWVQSKYEKSLTAIVPYQSAKGINGLENIDDDAEEESHKVLTDNLYISFGFLVEAFSKTLPAYHDDDGPIVMAIARRLETMAKEAYGGKDFLPGQKRGAIKLKIVEAMKRKKAKLEGKL
jgi:hypothetical protein